VVELESYLGVATFAAYRTDSAVFFRHGRSNSLNFGDLDFVVFAR
jgi:hypothetical protein